MLCSQWSPCGDGPVCSLLPAPCCLLPAACCLLPLLSSPRLPARRSCCAAPPKDLGAIVARASRSCPSPYLQFKVYVNRHSYVRTTNVFFCSFAMEFFSIDLCTVFFFRSRFTRGGSKKHQLSRRDTGGNRFCGVQFPVSRRTCVFLLVVCRGEGRVTHLMLVEGKLGLSLFSLQPSDPCVRDG